MLDFVLLIFFLPVVSLIQSHPVNLDKLIEELYSKNINNLQRVQHQIPREHYKLHKTMILHPLKTSFTPVNNYYRQNGKFPTHPVNLEVLLKELANPVHHRHHRPPQHETIIHPLKSSNPPIDRHQNGDENTSGCTNYTHFILLIKNIDPFLLY